MALYEITAPDGSVYRVMKVGHDGVVEPQFQKPGTPSPR